MKKLIVILCAAMLCLSFAACGEKEPAPQPDNPGSNNTPVDTPSTDSTPAFAELDQLFEELCTKVTYSDSATALDSSMAAMLLGFQPAGDCRIAINDVSNLRVGVFACADEAAAADTAEQLKGFIANMIDTNSGYAPDEVKLLENAAPVVKGNVVILCVTADTAGVSAVLDKYFA